MPCVDIAFKILFFSELRIVSQQSRLTRPTDIAHPRSTLRDGDGGILLISDGQQRMHRAVLIIDTTNGLADRRPISQQRGSRRTSRPSVPCFQLVNCFPDRTVVILHHTEYPPERIDTNSPRLIARSGSL